MKKIVGRKTFDIGTVAGIRRAERYKAHLENKYNRVETLPCGLDRVCVWAVIEREQELAAIAQELKEQKSSA